MIKLSKFLKLVFPLIVSEASSHSEFQYYDVTKKYPRGFLLCHIIHWIIQFNFNMDQIGSFIQIERQKSIVQNWH